MFLKALIVLLLVVISLITASNIRSNQPEDIPTVFSQNINQCENGVCPPPEGRR